MKRCNKCKRFLFGDETCQCMPFDVIDENGELHKIYALHEEDAALEFARQYNDNGDYLLMNETMIIDVDGAKYCIGAEPDIHYSAQKL